MLFSLGTRVAFLHGREKGVITEILNNGMVMVRLEDEDMEIPAAREDLLRQDEKSSPGARFILDNTVKKTKTPPPSSAPETQYRILHGKGLQIAFVPEVELDLYELFLLNDTSLEFTFDISLCVNDQNFLEKNGKITGNQSISIGTMQSDLLNDRPRVIFSGQRITTEGVGPVLNGNKQIKPKPFFKNQKMSPFLNRKAHVFALVEMKMLLGKTKQAEDLRDYTRKSTRKKAAKSSSPFWNDPLQAAFFEQQLDLHAEVAFPDIDSMRPEEIFPAQMREFENYMARAIHFGCAKVNIVHGKGNGRLRNAIAQRLTSMSDVGSFRHSHDQGATEVIFK